MPAAVERCVSDLKAKWKANPSDRPKPQKEGQTAEDQAWAICQAAQKAEESIEAIMLEGVGPVILGVAATNRPHLPLPPMSIVEKDGKDMVRVPFLRQGIYAHPKGKLVFNDKTFQRMLDNRKHNHYGVSLDIRHKPELGALAWLTDGIVEEVDDKYGKLLVGYGPPTSDEARAIIENKQYQYASIEFHPDYPEEYAKALSSDSLREIPLEELLQEVDMEKQENGDVMLSAEEFAEFEKAQKTVVELEAKVKEIKPLETKVKELEDQVKALTPEPDEDEMPDHIRVQLEEHNKEMRAMQERMLAAEVAATIERARAYRDTEGRGHSPVLLEWAENAMRGKQIGEGDDVIKLEDTSPGGVAQYVNQAVAWLLNNLPGQVPFDTRTEPDDTQLEQKFSKEDFAGFWGA